MKKRNRRKKERSRGMFYRDPMVDAKCTYQNSELTHIMADMAKVDSWTLHAGLRVTFVRRIKKGNLQNKEL